jgi:hypothetical protein
MTFVRDWRCDPRHVLVREHPERLSRAIWFRAETIGGRKYGSLACSFDPAAGTAELGIQRNPDRAMPFWESQNHESGEEPCR